MLRLTAFCMQTLPLQALEQQKQDRRKATADAAETKASNKDVSTLVQPRSSTRG